MKKKDAFPQTYKRFTRREFLKGAGGITLGIGLYPPIPKLHRWQEKEKTLTKSVVGLARGESIRESVRRAVALSGGMGFIQAGDTVLVKPNVNTADPYPGTSNPEVVHEVVKMVWEQDPARVIVADRSSMGVPYDTMDAMKKLGLYDAAKDAKAEVMSFDYDKWILTNPPAADHWKENHGFHIPALLGKVDKIIAIPVIKTHGIAFFTMSLKIFIGLIHLNDRYLMHGKHTSYRAIARARALGEEPPKDLPDTYPIFARMIVETGLAINPSLIVMDGTKAFVSGGPSRGDEVEPNLIVASRDRIANDVTGLAILKKYGTEERIQQKSVWEQVQIKRAVELGLGAKELSQIDLKAEGVPELEEIKAQMV